MNTIILAVDIAPDYFSNINYHYNFRGIYSNLSLAKSKIEKSVEENKIYRGFWRKPRTGDPIGFFSNYTFREELTYIYDVQTIDQKDVIHPNFLILVGVYKVQEN